jgi:hypothetical protein
MWLKIEVDLTKINREEEPAQGNQQVEFHNLLRSAFCPEANALLFLVLLACMAAHFQHRTACTKATMSPLCRRHTAPQSTAMML